MPDVLGWDVVGEDDELEGAEDYEDIDGDMMGAARPVRRIVPVRRPALRLPAKPGWRKAQVTPGVNAPDQMLYPLPLTGVEGSAFAVGTTSINFLGRPQKPFRGERLVITFARPSTSAGVLLIVTAISVGTDLQMVELGSMPAEAFSPTAFGVRLKMKPAAVGNEVSVRMSAVGVFGAGDTIPTAVAIFGRVIA